MSLRLVKRMLRPVRLALGRFAITPERLRTINPITTMTLIEKVAWYVAAEKIEGDYLEFGVYEGQGIVRAYLAFKAVYDLRTTSKDPNSSPEDIQERKRLWESMRFFAFDSYEGLPPLKGIDSESHDFHAGQYAAGIAHVRNTIQIAGVPLGRVVFVPGWFEKTCTPEALQRHKLTKAAVIHIDCDLYTSARTALAFLEPILQDGTVVIFDDWFCFRANPRRGERRAFLEWAECLKGRYTFTEYHREGYSRNSFIANEVVED